MLQQQTIAAYNGGGIRRSRTGAQGFSAFGDDAAQGIIAVDSATVTAAEVLARIKLNNGSMTIANDPATDYVQVVNANPSLFTVRDAGNGLITIGAKAGAGLSSAWIHGGLALVGVLLVTGLSRR